MLMSAAPSFRPSQFIIVRADETPTMMDGEPATLSDDDGPTLRSDGPTLSERHLLPALLGYGTQPGTQAPAETTHRSDRPIARIVGAPPKRRASPSVPLRGRPITAVFKIVEAVYATPAAHAAQAPDPHRVETAPLPVFRAAETGMHAFDGIHIVDLDEPAPRPADERGADDAPARVVRVRPPTRTPTTGPRRTRPRVPGAAELRRLLNRPPCWTDHAPIPAARRSAVVFRAWRPTQLPRRDLSSWPQPATR